MIQILHGDCLKLFPKVQDNSVDLIISDPPYNVYENSVVKMAYQRRKKNVEWDQFDENFGQFSMEWIDLSIQKLKPQGSLFIFGGVNYGKGNDLIELIPILRKKLHFVNLIVWHYPNGYGSRRFFSNRYELIAWFAKGKKYKFNLDNVRIPYDEQTLKTYLKDKRLRPENVAKGKNPTNVWTINHLNGNQKSRLAHPTQKPEEIIQRIVYATTDENDLVLDPFVGSGTTAKVCQELHRNCIAFELNTEYYQMAMKRCQLEPQNTEVRHPRPSTSRLIHS